MRLKILWFLFPATLCLASEPVAQQPIVKAPIVRVRVLSGIRDLEITGSGLVFNGKSAASLSKISYLRDESFHIHGESVDGSVVWVVRGFSALQRFSTPYLEVRSSSEKTAKVLRYQLPMPLLLTPAKQGTDVIAAMPLNRYLVHVLKGEMPSTWPREALKAQAIAARTYTLFQVNQRLRQPYHLEGSVLDQVFALNAEGSIEKIYGDVVRETEGQVLLQDSHLIKAYYHADCGGRTEEPSQVWGTREKIRSVVDKNCPYSPQARWNLKVSLEELGKEVRKHHPEVGILREVQILSRTPTQRVALVALNGSNTEVHVSAQQLREIMGFARLRSALFEMKKSGRELSFEGKGFGHGTGLCQWGAKALAEQRRSYAEILNHYYSGSRLARLNWRESSGF